MSQMLVRDLDPEVLERLKMRARSNGRSLQKEVREIPAGAVETYTMAAEAGEATGRWQERFAGQKFTDSAALIRKDRDA